VTGNRSQGTGELLESSSANLAAVAKIESHRDLLVWQKSMDLTVLTYRMSRKFPAYETYRLVSQLTRSAASVPANIAEGHARGTRRDYSNFLAIAMGLLWKARPS
jgi:hypothetical protein